MSLKISVRKVENVAVLDLGGRITMGEAAGSLRDTIKELLASNHQSVLLNLAGVTYIDSSGLGDLVGAFASASSRGARLKLLNMRTRVLELMQITKLYSVFETFEDEVVAIRSFSDRAA
jgi:anti-sigma B factor antagonist